MDKPIWKKINADELVSYKQSPDATYGSKLLMGTEFAGMPVININEGILEPFSRTAGATHEGLEIYAILDVGDDCDVVLNDEHIHVRNGDIITIPGGVFHWIDNTRCDKPFKLWTLWDRQELNGMFFKRKKEWGTSMRFVKDEPKAE